MEFDEIRQIVELMDEHNLSLFHLEREGINLKLKKGLDADDILPWLRAQGQAVFPATGPATGGSGGGAGVTEGPLAATNEKEIASPMVGTFYRAPTPDAGPYVSVGDEVNEDSVVCIVEAMKVMNEIKAELKGTVTKVLVEDGTPVQYGQPLFLVSDD